MIIDILHNKIIAETVTDSFKVCVSDNLASKIEAVFGKHIELLQMYEDHIKDDFSEGGFWYYPFSLLLEGECITAWARWDISDKSSYQGGNPYAFSGDKIDFELVSEVPERMKNAIAGRTRIFNESAVKINVHTPEQSPTFLAGRYSQTFIDEMRRQLTPAIEETAGVRGIAGSSVEIDLVFAPETYMEHTSENVTYRRLLMTAKGCAPRDFWVKWTRLDGQDAYTVTDNVCGGDIRFEIGEDVGHKIREKEYRFLVFGNSDKYRSAMGKKNITEWRDIIKRSIKRGELEKCESYTDVQTHAKEINDKLSEILARSGISTAPAASEVEEAPMSAEFEEAMRIAARAAASYGGNSEIGAPDDEVEENSVDVMTVEEDADVISETSEAVAESAPLSETFGARMSVYKPTDVKPVALSEQTSEIENISMQEPVEERRESEEEQVVNVPVFDVPYTTYAAEMRENTVESQEKPAVSQAAPNEEYAKLLADMERMRTEMENAKREREELMTKLAASEQEKSEQQRRLREQMELELKKNEREKALFAEAARIAREEADRLNAERAEAERAAKAEEERRLAEERERAELERIEAERRAEVLRIEREKAAREEERRNAERLVEEARQRSKDRLAEARARNEQMAREMAERMLRTEERSEPAPEALTSEPVKAEPVAEVKPRPEYTYVRKLVRLIFRHNVDPNITSRIKEMIVMALDCFGKADVYMKIKAAIPEPNVVALNFAEYPEQEMQMLIDIIQILGNSDLGITKIIME